MDWKNTIQNISNYFGLKVWRWKKKNPQNNEPAQTKHNLIK